MGTVLKFIIDGICGEIIDGLIQIGLMLGFLWFVYLCRDGPAELFEWLGAPFAAPVDKYEENPYIVPRRIRILGTIAIYSLLIGTLYWTGLLIPAICLVMFVIIASFIWSQVHT